MQVLRLPQSAVFPRQAWFNGLSIYFFSPEEIPRPEEVSRAMHFLIAAQNEAIQLYRELATCANPVKKSNLLRNVAEEVRFYTETAGNTGNNPVTGPVR